MSSGDRVFADHSKDQWAVGSIADDRRVALSVRNVGKRFRVPHERVTTLKQRIIQPRGRGARTFDALRDIDFDIFEGEFFGIVGRNGSGKSTLLKCMAGIYRPNDGEIAVRGKLATFIELGVGFNPELSARDNVIINGTLLGLTADQAEARFDEIIEFAELEEFVDLKLKNYSSGMHVRLAFAVATHVDADILLIDEVLAVGDAAFQQKCFDSFRRIREQGRTVVFVTHAMDLVERFCSRALMLERGEIVSFGDPPEVAVDYLRMNFDHMSDGPESADTERYGDGAAEVYQAWFEDASENVVSRIDQGAAAVFKMRVRFARELHDPVFSVSVRDHDRNAIFNASSTLDGKRTGKFAAGSEAIWAVRFENTLEDGRYLISPAVVHDGGINVADLRQDMFSVLVAGRQGAGGRVNLPHTTEVIQ